MSMSVYKPTAERQNVIDVHVCAAFLCLLSLMPCFVRKNCMPAADDAVRGLQYLLPV